MSTYIGQRFGDYRLTRFLGKGSFGEVYLAEHVHEHTPAAVKLILARLRDDSLKEFISEANTLFQLQHPNVVCLLGFGVGKDDTPFLAMAYAPNGTLRQRYPKGTRLSLEAVVGYVKPIALALQYAHDKRLIHRDVKPENILLGPNNEVWLSDFGITAIAHSTRSYDTEKPGGTIPYMAPEQLRGKPRPASDQYALGIMAYEWFCGERPFGGTATEIAMQHLIEPPSSLREKVPGISPEVEQVVLTALAKKPEERFGSVQAFAHALEQAYKDELEQVRKVEEERIRRDREEKQARRAEEERARRDLLEREHQTELERVRKETEERVRKEETARRAEEERLRILGQRVPPVRSAESIPNQPPPPVISQQSQPSDAVSYHTTPVAPSTRANVPPGVAVANRPITRRKVLIGLGGVGLAATGAIGWWELARRSPVVSVTPTPTPKPVGLLYTYHGHSGIVNDVAWSPDSKRIASAAETVQVWDATNGGNVFTYRGHTSNTVISVAWSPDGKRIASADENVQVWDAATGKRVLTLDGSSPIAWSPDGKRIASASGSSNQTVQVWDATNGGNVFTHNSPESESVFSIAWSPDGKRIASGTTGMRVQVWDATNGGNVFNYHTPAAYPVVWSPDGKYIASGGADNVQVWEALTGKKLLTFMGHGGNGRNALAWSPDGKHIASGNAETDYTVQVWDATNGGNVFTYRGHSGNLEAVAWSPDGKFIASGGNDQTVQVWQPIL